MRAPARLGVVLGVLAAGVSCRQIVGIDDRTYHDGGPLVCELPTLGATPDCAPCMNKVCCAQSTNCANTAPCTRISDCVHACPSGDAPCRAKCPEGLAPDTGARQMFDLVEACREKSCADECTRAPWVCLDRVEWNFPPFVLPQLSITATLLQPSDGGVMAVRMATGRVCFVGDPNCASPFATGRSDDQGIIKMNVDTRLHPPPLDVFVDYRIGGLLDTIVSLNTPPVSANLDLGPLTMDSAASVALAATKDLRTTYDPTRAIVAVFPYDCEGRPASLIAKVEFPDADAQTATLQPYPVTGEALAMNLPVNAPALLAPVVARVWGKTQIVALTHVVVRPGAKTWVYLNPTP